ncbi:unnamed protein product [Effrenium voratum]|nr:unnamed protein product [Effrenium voratum]
MASMDPKIRDQILQDPQVQAAVKKAGQDALSDPAVQAEIMKVAKEKFPEAASAAKDKIVEWANDPEVQKAAYKYAGVAADYAWQSVSQVGSLIEQGPAGVRVLAFVGGVGALAQSIWVLCGLLNPAAAATMIPKYVVHFYQATFAMTTMLFEAKPEWIQQVPGLNAYQDMLISKAKFLAEATGRGLFYGFQGTLWLCFASLTDLVHLALGGWFLFMAFLHILMGFGIMPQEVAKKMQEVREIVAVGSMRSMGGETPGIQKDASKVSQPKAQGGAMPDEEQGVSSRPDKEPLLGGGDEDTRRVDATPASTTKGVQPKQGGKGGCCSVQ